MFHLLLGSRRTHRPVNSPRRMRPQLEILEARDCPSAPVAVNDSYSILQNGTISSGSPGVLSNDTGSGSLTAAVPTNPSHGSVTLNSNGSFTYTPNGSYLGNDSFTYEAYDGTNYSSPATVALYIDLAAQPGGTITGAEGSQTDAATASFQSNNSSATTSNFVASIDWGDGTSSSTGTINQLSMGSFTASGSHTYALPGNYTVRTIITDNTGNSVTTQTAAVINNVVPTLTANLAYGSQRSVTLSGRVSDGSPGGLTVTFTGVVTGTTTTSADGTYGYTTNASALGNLSVTVTNRGGLTSNAVTRTVQSNAPAITNFLATRQTGNTWTFSGSVSDESYAGLPVQFGDMAFMCTQSTTVHTDGTFSLTITLPAGSSGLVSAEVTDWWGLTSNVPERMVNAS